MMLSTVSWTGGGHDNLWNDAKNWNTDTVPTASSDVVINVSGTSPTIHYSGGQSIHSLTSNASISIDSGSLTDATTAKINGNATLFRGTWLIYGGMQVGGAATLDGVTLDGALTVQSGRSLTLKDATTLNGTVTFGTSASLTATTGETGSISTMASLSNVNLVAMNGAVLSFPAATTLTNVNMTASTGGQILFPAATSYSGGNTSTTIDATGSSSKIDLSHLKTFAGGGQNGIYSYHSAIQAQAGGEVDLAGAFSVNIGGGRNVVTLTGAGSTLGAAGVTSLNQTNVTATGATLTFPAVTTLSGVNLTASGSGQILFPAATSYTGGNTSTTIDATGSGSKIDLSHLKTFAGGGATESTRITRRSRCRPAVKSIWRVHSASTPAAAATW